MYQCLSEKQLVHCWGQVDRYLLVFCAMTGKIWVYLEGYKTVPKGHSGRIIVGQPAMIYEYTPSPCCHSSSTCCAKMECVECRFLVERTLIMQFCKLPSNALTHLYNFILPWPRLNIFLPYLAMPNSYIKFFKDTIEMTQYEL